MAHSEEPDLAPIEQEAEPHEPESEVLEQTSVHAPSAQTRPSNPRSPADTSPPSAAGPGLLRAESDELVTFRVRARASWRPLGAPEEAATGEPAETARRGQEREVRAASGDGAVVPPDGHDHRRPRHRIVDDQGVEAEHLGDGRLGDHGRRRALGHDRAVLHRHEVVGVAAGQVQVVEHAARSCGRSPALSSASRSSTSIWWARSRKVVGSSSSMMSVPWASAMAIHTRWR